MKDYVELLTVCFGSYISLNKIVNATFFLDFQGKLIKLFCSRLLLPSPDLEFEKFSLVLGYYEKFLTKTTQYIVKRGKFYFYSNFDSFWG